MRKFKHILAVVEPGSPSDAALKRAFEIARFSPGAQITAMIAVYDFSADLLSTLEIHEQMKLKDELAAAHEHMIAQKIGELNTEHSDIDYKVVWQRGVTKAIVEEINSGDYDLLIKGVDSHDFFMNMLFTPLDWKLLRYSPIPVLIAKDHSWESNSNILVAVSFDDDNDRRHRLLNLKLLRHAQQLKTLINGQIHLINAAVPANPSTMVEIPGFSPDLYSETVYNHNLEQMTSFAGKHHIPRENCHVCIGQTGDVIGDLAAKLGARAVLIGTSARKGLKAAVIGNICEQIVDEIDCDLFVTGPTV